jgi:hypothetical protein
VFQQLILLLKVEAGVELVALRAFFGKRGSGPIHFKEWAGDVGHTKLIFL